MESLEELTRLIDSGVNVKFLQFWGHTPRVVNGIDAACLSQWWPAEFTVEGHRFADAEHYMMWRKARLFGDLDISERVLASRHPGQAKQLGRRVDGFDEEVWRRHRVSIVVDGNRAKFTQDDRLRDYLVGTGQRVLVEASPIDRVWGSGLARDHPDAARPENWPGANLLGFALMRVRHELMRSNDV